MAPSYSLNSFPVAGVLARVLMPTRPFTGTWAATQRHPISGIGHATLLTEQAPFDLVAFSTFRNLLAATRNMASRDSRRSPTLVPRPCVSKK